MFPYLFQESYSSKLKRSCTYTTPEVSRIARRPPTLFAKHILGTYRLSSRGRSTWPMTNADARGCISQHLKFDGVKLKSADET